jgi:cell division protein FtsL
MAAHAPTAAAPAPLRAPARRVHARRAAYSRRAHQRSLLRGIVSIAVLAVLLAGVVALNVAVLDLNLQLDRLARERAELRATNAALEAQASSAAAPPRIGAIAQKRLGLVPAAPEQTTYVKLGK